jgi:hypothetical protein
VFRARKKWLLGLFWLSDQREVSKKAKRDQSKASHTRARRGKNATI